MNCNHWDSSCHLGNPELWESCQTKWRDIEGKELECSELQFGWIHYPDSPFGDVDICPHGVCRTHNTQDAVCKWCDSSKQSTKPQGKCKWCGSDNGDWTSIYDWHCRDCGKVTID